ncbi:imidazole glycerol phosphate synthase subunit HisH [Gammaproteobacteria bacterium]|nr:imidazole glycerol phosphate synthase subunit HisH [Gammaproteobacteria bacterium]
MIVVVDYGVGNVQSFLSLYKRAGINCERASTARELETATHLILPGVGHFDHAMKKLQESGLVQMLERLVMIQKIPILGICVGMQMLSSYSEEGSLPGLNWIPGVVRQFSNSTSSKLPMPHMGWNTVKPTSNSILFDKDLLPKFLEFYFLHSYYFVPTDYNHIAAETKYGIEFCSAISKDNIHGIQCHPEKSHDAGVEFLKRFSEL